MLQEARIMRRFPIALVTTLTVALGLSACSGGDDDSGGGGTAAKPTNCTNKVVHEEAPRVLVWAWYPNMAKVVDNFNNQHTDVQVCWTNAGQGQPEYEKFQTAIAAKKGAPDVIMLEADQLVGFEIQDALVDLAPFGANDVKKNFSEGAWKDVSQGEAVYAIPVDGGPMALIYRTDIFDKYKIKPPKTWAEYAESAAKVKSAGGPVFGDFGSNVPAVTTALMIQKGAQPFVYDLSDKQNITVKLDDQATKDVLSFWGDLVKKGLVGKEDQFTTDYIAGMVGGKYATYVSAGVGARLSHRFRGGCGQGQGQVRGGSAAAVGRGQPGVGELGRVGVRGHQPGRRQGAGGQGRDGHLRRRGVARGRLEDADDLPAQPGRAEVRRVRQREGRVLRRADGEQGHLRAGRERVQGRGLQPVHRVLLRSVAGPDREDQRG
ncbi:extracellular solute-binding protein [Actinoplanes sp. TRM 88003]|uniref:Extracellular solute-binding protein n=1 Tax=Paractinoplanes aksuensis TaxID=2939490 RepID=A0ABT1E1V5_9ACTN|nr:extracellular solute-binding protein [Actinoplanes aksuensis]MCO8277094.1 extracellular solute-binding protein [Actinoplanes aksuensis]